MYAAVAGQGTRISKRLGAESTAIRLFSGTERTGEHGQSPGVRTCWNLLNSLMHGQGRSLDKRFPAMLIWTLESPVVPINDPGYK